ncbi:MAG TPA: hypothetical protein VFO31_30155 [Vicinamibacterales bacterium]|nr:hypothetical protein [Vicinamibacterales bacterium]
MRPHYPAKPSKDQCVALCNEVAWMHRAEGFGVAEKTSGTHGTRSDGQRCAIDGLVYRPPGGGVEQFIDILGNADGSSPPYAVPRWQVHDTSNRKWIAPIDPGTAPPDPPDPPDPPPADYVTQADLLVYDRSVNDRLAALRDEQLTLIRALDARIVALEARVDALESAETEYVLVPDPSAPAVRTSSASLAFTHAHDLRARVERKRRP